MEKLEIFFNDLKPEVQEKVLEFYECKERGELNADIFTVAILEKEV